jgi:dTDP-4-amino-4,6-dideoxygalactose transaminase
VSTPRIPLLVPELPSAEDVLPYLKRIDTNRWYTNFGPLNGELEARLLAQCNAPGSAVVTVSSCTLGLELGLLALGLRAGARVLIPSFTFVATATAVLRAGMRVAVADVDRDTWLLTPEIAEAAVKAGDIDCVMPVATFGHGHRIADWDAFSERTGIPVFIDAAGAFGNQDAGHRTHMVFSMHATKSLGSAEGGFVISADLGFIERIRKLSNFGIEGASGIVNTAGSNAKLSEYHAAIGLAALDRWPAHVERRRALHLEYIARFSERCAPARLQKRPEHGIYTILAACLPSGTDARAVAEKLERAGIGTRRWYHPLINRHPGFAACTVAGSLTQAESISGQVLGLPFHTFLSGDDIAQVCDALADAIAKRP